MTCALFPLEKKFLTSQTFSPFTFMNALGHGLLCANYLLLPGCCSGFPSKGHKLQMLTEPSTVWWLKRG